jgi:hypothetical protein
LCDKSIDSRRAVCTLSERVTSKLLGMDKLPCEFSKSTSDFVGQDFLQLYKEAIGKQSLGATLKKGIIEFIPKVDDFKLLTS